MKLNIFQFYYVSSAESGEHNKKYESKCEICSNSFIKCNIEREIHNIIKRRAMNNIKKVSRKMHTAIIKVSAHNGKNQQHFKSN